MTYALNTVSKATQTTRRNKRPVTVFLSGADFNRLSKLCRERGQSRADFLRCAMEVPEAIPTHKTRPLAGVCKRLHEARLRRERRARAKE